MSQQPEDHCQTPPPTENFDSLLSTSRFLSPPSARMNRAPTSHAGTKLLNKRYEIFEDITPSTQFVYGVDRRSIQPRNRHVVIRVFSNEEDWTHYKSLLSKLRSPFVSALLDEWKSEEYVNVWFTAQDRGGLRFDELIESPRLFRESEQKQNLLAELAKCWIFLHSAQFVVVYQPHCFMQFGTTIRLWDPTCLRPIVLPPANILAQPPPTYTSLQLPAAPSSPSASIVAADGGVYDPVAADPPTDVLSCPPEIADAILAREESFLQSTHVDIGALNLGALLLELFLYNPIFNGKTPEEVAQLLELGDAIRPYVEDEDDLEAVNIVRCITSHEAHTLRETNERLAQCADLVKRWFGVAAAPGSTSGSARSSPRPPSSTPPGSPQMPHASQALVASKPMMVTCSAAALNPPVSKLEPMQRVAVRPPMRYLPTIM